MSNANAPFAGYEQLDPMVITDNFIKRIGKDWLLVTAGTKESYNTMTVSWGAIGYIWNKPAAFSFIRNTRYTYEFLQREESYTLSFFGGEYKKALGVCGSQSGRDTNKVADAGLTGMELPSGLMSFAEATLIIECRKMFITKMNWEGFLDSYKETMIQQWYTKDTAKHDLFVSEIVGVWAKI